MPKLHIPANAIIAPNVIQPMQSIASMHHNVRPQAKDAINSYIKHFRASSPSPEQSAIFDTCVKAVSVMCSPQEVIGAAFLSKDALPLGSNLLINLDKSLEAKMQKEGRSNDKANNQQDKLLATSKDLFVMMSSCYVGLSGALSLAVFGDAQHNNAQQNAHMAGFYAGEVVNAVLVGLDCLKRLKTSELVKASHLSDDGPDNEPASKLNNLIELASACTVSHNKMLDLVESLEPIVQSHVDEKISGLGMADTVSKIQRAINSQAMPQNTRTLN